LSFGRAAVAGKGAVAAQLAAVIATRYSAVRKQFRTAAGEELPVIEYAMQQHRVFPLIATAVAHHIFYRKFVTICYKHFKNCFENEDDSEQRKQLCATSRELHVLGCSAKVILTETGVNALDEARLACGGHGFVY
uniref:Acyl-CoA_dh_1 domain-containing protein n=1 Tax=Gongylonema pulchrum TaxID=637853 RepID=A0A183D690_9BILA